VSGEIIIQHCWLHPQAIKQTANLENCIRPIADRAMAATRAAGCVGTPEAGLA
jgi:hypothetical protein